MLTECAQPGWMSNCDGAINTAQSFINTTLPSRLGTLYSGIRSRSPYAKVVVVGYPRIFNGEDCNAFTWFSPAEESRLNQTADLLNCRLAAAASAAGFSFANPTSRFIGHAVCDADEWINGLSNPISESYHPKANGHAGGYTPAVSPLLTGAAVAVTAQVVADSAASGDEPGRAAAAVRRRGPHHRAGGLRRPRPDHPRGAPRGPQGRRRPRPLHRAEPVAAEIALPG